MFVKIDVLGSNLENLLINTDNISKVYNETDNNLFYVEYTVGSNIETYSLTEDSYRKLIGFLFRDKKTNHNPNNIVITTASTRKPYNFHKRTKSDEIVGKDDKD